MFFYLGFRYKNNLGDVCLLGKRPKFFCISASHILNQSTILLLIIVIIIITALKTRMATSAKQIQITEQTSRAVVENQLRVGLDVVCYQRGACIFF